ncbi:MAG: PaaI family thioesterase [Rhodobacteraceae bacterium]|nr:PaaI family thioesterase [Paracoccaceae bacterium]
MSLKMSIEELREFMADVFPQVDDAFEVTELAPNVITVRMKISDRHLRPGGTVSGPSMFLLADCAYYLATLAMIGPKALAVTTNCSIDFLRKPAPGDMFAKARVLKLGKMLSVGDVLLFSEGVSEPVARASLTYSIPPVK